MVSASASLIFIFGTSAGLIAAAGWLSLRLTREARRRELTKWLAAWVSKGFLVPLAIWGLMNLGLSWNLQAFMPDVQAAQNRGSGWASEFIHVLSIGAFILSTYWVAVTLAWVLVRSGREMPEEPRKDFKTLCRACVLGLSIPAFILLLLGGWTTLGLAGMLVAGPLAWYAPALLNPPKLPPMYARAVARMKFGKYSEAEWEIIHELEKAEDDFEGWMMLAELYAVQFRDLSEAERVVLELCQQPRVTASQLSVALHRLADWQLKVAANPEGCRRALQLIIVRLPGTHLAHMAQLRLNQIPATSEELQQRQNLPPIPLPSLGDQLDVPPVPEEALDKAAAARAANLCVEKLKQDPNNAPAREKLARLFAEQLNRPELGLEQLELLLGMTEPSAPQRAVWLSLMGAWHLKYRHDSQAAQPVLERLIRDFPETPEAFAARRRLEQLKASPLEPTAEKTKPPIRIRLAPRAPPPE